eukprot:COSAG02_NODE_41817_length_390_cov_1.415808_1_plen_130_part_11
MVSHDGPLTYAEQMLLDAHEQLQVVHRSGLLLSDQLDNEREHRTAAEQILIEEKLAINDEWTTRHNATLSAHEQEKLTMQAQYDDERERASTAMTELRAKKAAAEEEWTARHTAARLVHDAAIAALTAEC